MNTSPPLLVGELTGLTPRTNGQRLAAWHWKRGRASTYRIWQKPERKP